MIDTISHNPTDSVALAMPKVMEQSHLQDNIVSVPFTDFDSLIYHNPFWKVTEEIVQENNVLFDGFVGKELPITNFTHIFLFLFVLFFGIFAFFSKNRSYSLIDRVSQILSFKDNRITNSKEQITATEARGELFLILQGLIVTTMIIFNFLHNQYLSTLGFGKLSLVFLLILLAISLIVGTKYLIYNITDSILFDYDTKEWINKFVWLIELVSIIIVIPAIVYIFMPEYEKVALYMMLFIAILCKLVIFRILLNIFSKNRIGIFYYIVYLCSVEIAPFFLMYKGAILLINNIGGSPSI